MGSTASKLVRPGELSSPVQRDHLICCQLCCLPGHSSIEVFNEPASFNEPKPYGLSVTDDTWASLKLRVDPLARHILDPHRSYVGAAFLGLFVAAVFTAVRPGWHIVDLSSYYDKQNQANNNYYDPENGGGGSGEGNSYYNYYDNNNNGHSGDEEDDDALDNFYARERDDDYYNNDGIDDIVLAELEYRNEELVHAAIFWRIGFIASLTVLFLATVTVAVGMELKNARYDAKIHDVIAEMRERFEAEGYEIGYRTRTEISGVLFGHLRPQRVIFFKRKDDELYHPPVGMSPTTSTLGRGAEGQAQGQGQGQGQGGSGSEAGSFYSASSFGGIGGVGVAGGGGSSIGMLGGGRYAKTVKDAEERGGEILFVKVPEGRKPGQLVTVLTPSGDHIMVAIPARTRPGQSFPVLVPPKPMGGGSALSPTPNVAGYGSSSIGGGGDSGIGGSPTLRSRAHGVPKEFEMGKLV